MVSCLPRVALPNHQFILPTTSIWVFTLLLVSLKAHAVARPLKSRLGKLLTLRNEAVLDGWYRGDMKRRDCEDAIEYGDLGDFIVRKSTSGDSYTICVNDGGRAVSFSIKTPKRGQFVFRKETYLSLQAVIDDLRVKPLKSKRGGKFHVTGPPECLDLVE